LTGYTIKRSVKQVKVGLGTNQRPPAGWSKEMTMEILIFVALLVVLDVAAQLYATDSRPPDAERRRA